MEKPREGGDWPEATKGVGGSGTPVPTPIMTAVRPLLEDSNWVPRVGVGLGGPSNYHHPGVGSLSCSH